MEAPDGRVKAGLKVWTNFLPVSSHPSHKPKLSLLPPPHISIALSFPLPPVFLPVLYYVHGPVNSSDVSCMYKYIHVLYTISTCMCDVTFWYSKQHTEWSCWLKKRQAHHEHLNHQNQTSQWGGTPPPVHKLAEGTSEYRAEKNLVEKPQCTLCTEHILVKLLLIGSMTWKFKLDEFGSDHVVYCVQIVF